MKLDSHFIARTLTVSVVFLVSCVEIQSPQFVQPISKKASQSPRSTVSPEIIPSIPVASIFIETPEPTMPPIESPAIAPSQQALTDSPLPTVAPTPTLQPTLKPTPRQTPTPTPSPIPTPSPTFARVAEDPRFEEYAFPPPGLHIGPPGIILAGDTSSAYPLQLTIDHRSGDIVVLWAGYDRVRYLLENNLLCVDPAYNDCFEWLAYFVYNSASDYWSFNKGLNSKGVTEAGRDIFGSAFDRNYIWWYLNRGYQTTTDPSQNYTTYLSGLVARLDVALNRFWVLQMNDMPSDVNGVATPLGTTPGIPYPPVSMRPDGWQGPQKSILGLITAQNALTYSPRGLYFFESEYIDWKLRIHFYSFSLPPEKRVWTTKAFPLSTGMFRGNPIESYVPPQVAYSKRDNQLYFMRRHWTKDADYGFRALTRIAETDAIP